MGSPSSIPEQVEHYHEIPARLRPAYELGALGSYVPNQVGATIGAYRAAREKDPHREPLAPRRKLTRQQWNTLLAVAEPEERSHFLRALAGRRITLTD
jgi:hypothetical protein